ncbi:MAG: NapC/NirT family cytochrome c [Acidobacteria bacterium]|nr:NapC/NirT family cytochrome c [Acidobacteriota bacterium]
MEPEGTPTEGTASPGVEEKTIKVPSLVQNYISLGGISVTLASVVSIVLLILIEKTNAPSTPYLGILTYILLPAGLVFGIFVILLGMGMERFRRRKLTPEQVAAYPILDLSGPRRRRKFLIFVFCTVLFLFVTAFSSYTMFEYTESVEFCGTRCHTVMKPEYTAYLAGSHARVRCVDCHVGSGADWYVKSKLAGAYQLYSVTFNKYSRPITTPVHNLRPAPDTCEQCHWPEKFFGSQMKVFNRYGNDEHNTLHQRKMLINVGGGNPQTGEQEGIHWHMNIANEINYIATDDHRQQIPWVQIKHANGQVETFTDRRRALSDADLDPGKKRRMDCMDCHNRPAHVYLPPDVAMDQAMAAQKIDVELPYIKRQGVEVLSGQYETTDQAVAAIDAGIHQFYDTNYPQLAIDKRDAINQAIGAIQTIFQTYFFPEMRTDWQTHPNNIGHLNSAGCFRCHDGQHVSDTGKVISNDCTICHTVIFDGQAPPAQNMKVGAFKHPVDLGALADRRCDSCHVPNKPFKHPINLGDISQFQCVVSHPRK